MIPGVKLRPLKGFCGCMSLSHGVLLAIGFSLLTNALLLTVISSEEPLYLGYIEITPKEQMMQGSLTVMGVPLAIIAGFGTIYRIPLEVWLFYYYQVISFLCDLFWAVKFYFGGHMCQAVAPEEVLRRGALFICVIIDGILLFYGIVLVIFRLYLIMVVWSEAKTIQDLETAYVRHMQTNNSLNLGVREQLIPGVQAIKRDVLAQGKQNDYESADMGEAGGYDTYGSTVVGPPYGAPYGAPNGYPMYG